MNCPALVLLEQPFRFPTRQPLVDHLDRQTHLLMHTLPEARRFFSHIAARAIQAEGQPNDDLLHTVFAHKFPQPPHVLVAIDAIQRPERLRQASFRIADGHTDSCAPIIQRKNA